MPSLDPSPTEQDKVSRDKMNRLMVELLGIDPNETISVSFTGARITAEIAAPSHHCESCDRILKHTHSKIWAVG